MKIDIKTISKCKKGDAQAQKLVYTTLLPYFNNIAKRYIQDSSTRSDALQETFIKIFTHVDQFDLSKGKFKSWSSRILINTCLQHVNKKIARNETELTATEYQIPINPNILQRLTNDELLIVLRKMPADYYQVFNLFVIDGYSHDEISVMLNIKTSLSRKRMSRAREWIGNRTELKTMIS